MHWHWQDLSIPWLLQFLVLEIGTITISNLSNTYKRGVADDANLTANAHTHWSVGLTALVLVVALLRALWKIIHKFN